MIRYLISRLIDFLHVPYDLEYSVTEILVAIAIFFIAGISFYIVRHFSVVSFGLFAKRTSTDLDDLFLNANVIQRFVYIVPAFIIYSFSHSFLPELPYIQTIISRLSVASMIVFAALSIDSVISVGEQIFKRSKLATRFSIKSYIQVIRIVLVFFVVLLVLAVLMDKRVVVFLSGFGALTAVLLLVFKDSILGLVASVQISATNIVREGDWIEIPSYGADGTVMEISLNTLTIQNFDNTMVIVPSHSVISSGFKNWRGMTDSKSRRIKKSIFLDLDSVKMWDSKLSKHLNKHPHIDTTFLDDIDLSQPGLTNLTVFRRYVMHYLQHHPNSDSNRTLLVRYLKPSSYGLPFEFYMFSTIYDWVPYEAISAEILEHILASLHSFSLRSFQVMATHVESI